MKVLLISSILETSLIYAINIAILITPSRTAITCSDVINDLKKLAITSGSIIKIPIARIKESTITIDIITLSSFSPKTRSRNFSNLPGSSSSSSSKKLAEYVRVFIPSIMESANRNTPLIKGRDRIFALVVILSYLSFFISISPSGLRTATA